MRVLVAIGQWTVVFALGLGIPAALLYPAVLWVAKHTYRSVDFIISIYFIGIGILFLPTWALVGVLYRKFILKKHPST